MKFIKGSNNRVQLIMRTNKGYFGIFYPVKQTEEYFEIVPLIESAQELIDNAN